MRCHIWLDNCPNRYFHISFFRFFVFSFFCFFVFSFFRFFRFLSTSKEWRKNCIELGTPLKIEKKKSKEIFLFSSLSISQIFFFFFLTFRKGQQKNWCVLVLHTMIFFLTMNIFTENYDAFKQLDQFDKIQFYGLQMKLLCVKKMNNF